MDFEYEENKKAEWRVEFIIYYMYVDHNYKHKMTVNCRTDWANFSEIEQRKINEQNNWILYLKTHLMLFFIWNCLSIKQPKLSCFVLILVLFMGLNIYKWRNYSCTFSFGISIFQFVLESKETFSVYNIKQSVSQKIFGRAFLKKEYILEWPSWL